MPQPTTPIEVRFWRYVAKTEGCWLWTGATTHGGYGVIQQGGRTGKIIRSHRLSYAMTYGSFDGALDVCHKCDNPRCVRPDHLFLGEAKDNVADMLAKGRASPGGFSRGEEHGRARLNWEKVRQIRSLYASGGHSLNSLAQTYGVSKKTVLNVVKLKIWLA